MCLAGLGQAPAPNTTHPKAQIDFDRDIQPILADKCFTCHGPDAGNRKAKLRLDRRANAFATRKHGAAIVPGAPDRSLLVQRILHRDVKKRMPPAKSGKTLDAGERRLLVAWIRQGAPWAEHWSFVAPRSPAVPTPAFPGAHNEIDAFVYARLAANKLRPSPRADRRTLVRRLTLDLTGLPPTMQEVKAFASDDTPHAYERLVDRLLASTAYGEHMAHDWLDAARYGDTHGLHFDNYREMWLYRDWVVKAFANNMPYDRFVVEQLAGDLLPNATLDQKIASGFNRCHVTTNEGGSIEEEVYVRNVIDRVSTTGTVFMGLTLGCAVCHDHKFDPIEQKEFYQLFAFFNNLDAKPMDGNSKAPAPVVRVPSKQQSAELAALRKQRAGMEARIVAQVSKVPYDEPPPPRKTGTRQRVVWIDDALPQGAQPRGELLWVESPHTRVHSGRLAIKLRASKKNAIRELGFRAAKRKMRIGAGDTLFAWVYLDPKDPPQSILLQWNGDGGKDWEHRAYWGKNVIQRGKNDSVARRHLGKLPTPGHWTRLQVPAARVGLTPGMAVHGLAFVQRGGTAYWDTAGIDTATPQKPVDHVWIDDDAPPGSKRVGNGKDSWHWVTTRKRSGTRSLRRSGKGLIQDYFTEARPRLRVQAGDKLFAHVWLDPKDPPKSVQLQFHAGNWEHRVRWGRPAHGAGRKGGANLVAGPLPAAGRWVRLEVAAEAVGLRPGQRIDGWAFTQVDGTVYWDQAGIHTWGPPDDRQRTSLRAWELVAANDNKLPKPVRDALGVVRAKRSKAQARRIQDHYLRYVFAGTRAQFDPLNQKLADIDKQLRAVEAKVPTTLVMRERKKPRPAFVLQRGQYDRRGERVVRQTPSALPPMPADLPHNRLGLARWLVARSHPLTARVAVNRFWQHFFGIGLVKTSEDFGNQGERPSHPQLLDWLACRFVDEGWDIKRLVRRIVLSATYRQASHIDTERSTEDPDNRLLARGPRFRLDAEELRDQALALSGLLVRTVGGPSVKPPQPAGLWKAVGYVGSNTQVFHADTGPEKVFRRSLYTFWKRTSPPPEMATFDAPSREQCRVRRERTNTPLQALLLMNDPQFVEAARCLATRAVHEGGATDEARAVWMFTLATCHAPSELDLAELLGLLGAQRAEFRAGPAAASALVHIGASKPDANIPAGELASWTMVANLILNLDQVLTKN